MSSLKSLIGAGVAPTIGWSQKTSASDRMILPIGGTADSTISNSSSYGGDGSIIFVPFMAQTDIAITKGISRDSGQSAGVKTLIGIYDYSYNKVGQFAEITATGTINTYYEASADAEFDLMKNQIYYVGFMHDSGGSFSRPLYTVKSYSTAQNDLGMIPQVFVASDVGHGGSYSYTYSDGLPASFSPSSFTATKTRMPQLWVGKF